MEKKEELSLFHQIHEITLNAGDDTKKAAEEVIALLDSQVEDNSIEASILRIVYMAGQLKGSNSTYMVCQEIIDAARYCDKALKNH